MKLKENGLGLAVTSLFTPTPLLQLLQTFLVQQSSH